MKRLFIVASGLFMISLNPQWQSTNPYSTHQPVLAYIAGHTSGPIVEFGCGEGSTDLLHNICKKTKRTLISIDDNLQWLNRYKQKYAGDGYSEDNSDWHKFLFVPGRTNDSDPTHWVKFLNNCTLLKDIRFDLCFIDQSPGLARTETLMRFKNKARFIILHDCDMYVADEYKDFVPGKQAVGKRLKPHNALHNLPGVYDFSKTFRSFKVFFPAKPWPGPTGPPTLLASNFEDQLPDVDYRNYQGS